MYRRGQKHGGIGRTKVMRHAVETNEPNSCLISLLYPRGSTGTVQETVYA